MINITKKVYNEKNIKRRTKRDETHRRNRFLENDRARKEVRDEEDGAWKENFVFDTLGDLVPGMERSDVGNGNGGTRNGDNDRHDT